MFAWSASCGGESGAGVCADADVAENTAKAWLLRRGAFRRYLGSVLVYGGRDYSYGVMSI